MQMPPRQVACWAANLAVERDTFASLCTALQGQVSEGTEWEALLALANRTLVTPTLGNALANNDRVPADVREFIAAVASRTLDRNLAMRRQLSECCIALSNCGVVPILIKGAAFMISAPLDANARLSTDLDLVLPADQKSDAIKALQTIGYEYAPSSISPDAGVNLQRSSDVGGLDIHYRLRSFHPQREYDDLRPYCEPVSVDGAAICVPSRELQLAILVAHDQMQERDYWRGLIDLRHMLDLRAIVLAGNQLDENVLARFFPEGPHRRALETQLLTLESVLGIAKPTRSVHGRRARLQVRRRRWQIGRAWALPAATAATLMIDPMRPPDAVLETGRWRSVAQYYRRMFVPAKDTKV